MKFDISKVLRKKLSKNPFHESKYYSSSSNSNTDRSSASSSSSSRSRHREDSARTVRKPDPRDHKSSRREEDRRVSSKSHGRR